MKILSLKYPVLQMAWVLGVSRSGYYRWLGQPEKRAHARSRRELIQNIRRIYEQNRRCYGSPRVHRQLRKEGILTSENRVARLMKAAGIKACGKRAYRPRTTDSHHPNPIAPNRLKNHPLPTAPDQVWVADITYLPIEGGWVYLAGVMDRFSRKIVGWQLSHTLKTSLGKEALDRA